MKQSNFISYFNCKSRPKQIMSIRIQNINLLPINLSQLRFRSIKIYLYNEYHDNDFLNINIFAHNLKTINLYTKQLSKKVIKKINIYCSNTIRSKCSHSHPEKVQSLNPFEKPAIDTRPKYSMSLVCNLNALSM